MKNDRYDVVVVGAGPGGSMAAREAAKAGAKTLLLERDPVIGTPVRCGEATSLSVLKEFIPIQDRWIAAIVDHGYIIVPSGESVEIVGKDNPEVILERNLFDRYLAELAAEAGARILTRADANGLLRQGDRISGVCYTRFGVRYEVGSAVVIGADGVDSRVGRWAGLNTQMSLRDLAPTYQFVVTGVDFDPTCAEIYVGSYIGAAGFIWIFPKSRTTVLIGIGFPAIDTDQGSAFDRLMSFLPRRFPKASVVGEMAGGVPGAPPLKKPVRDGLMLVGDAARHCNPITGGGIASAMRGGYHAGQTAAEAISEGDTSARRLLRFCDQIDKKILIPHRLAHNIRRALIGLTDEALNAAAKEINLIQPEERTFGMILYKILKNHPGVFLNAFRSVLTGF